MLLIDALQSTGSWPGGRGGGGVWGGTGAADEKMQGNSGEGSSLLNLSVSNYLKAGPQERITSLRAVRSGLGMPGDFME